MKGLFNGIRHYSVVVALISSTIYSVAFSQTAIDDFIRERNRQFEEYKDAKIREFNEYRYSINKEYSDFMRTKWDVFAVQPEIPIPLSPEPPVPAIVDPEEPRTEDPLPFSKIETVPEPSSPSVPLLPYQQPDKPAEPVISNRPKDAPEQNRKPDVKSNEVCFKFYGGRYGVSFEPTLKFSLSDLSENRIADAWDILSRNESLSLIEDCISLRQELCLSDWGYMRLVQNLCAEVYPQNRNEATLLQMFILTQCGYKVRLAKIGNKLMLLVPNRELLPLVYTNIGDEKYYVLDDDSSSGNIYIFNRSFPNEQAFSLALQQLPVLEQCPGEPEEFCSAFDDNIRIRLSINKNLIDFYNDYPLSSYWEIYANASLSDQVKSDLYPVLRAAISGKSQSEAANILLHFVQTAFKYMTDGQQFGYERPFFADETFGYPYSDCEDRAILYSVLVRDLLDLDVVLVHYEKHLATAVKFDEDVVGDYFAIDGERYIVCDPTYVNADIGMSMPVYKNASAELLRL